MGERNQKQGTDSTQNHHHVAASDGYGARSYWALTFFGVQTIGLHIPQVVETVDGAGDEAERCEDHQCRPEKFGLQQIVAEEYGCKHERVLKPLQRAKKLDVVYHHSQF